MDLIINLSLSHGRGERVRPVTDIRIEGLYGKMPDEVLAEVTEKLDGPINQTYTIIANELPDWEDS